MLGQVVPALIELLKSAILLSKAEDVLSTVGRVVHELVHDHDMVISGSDEVGRCGVCLPSEASVVLYTCIVATLSCLCCDEHDSGRCLCTIDGAGRSILEHCYRLDVVRVDLAQADLDSVRKDKRRSRVQRQCTTDIDVISGLRRTCTESNVYRRVSSLKGIGCRHYRTGIEVLSADCSHSTRKVCPLLSTVTDDDNVIQHVL